MCWKDIEEKVGKEDFKELLKIELLAFRDHVERVSTQYRDIKRLRENLPDGHDLI